MSLWSLEWGGRRIWRLTDSSWTQWRLVCIPFNVGSIHEGIHLTVFSTDASMTITRNPTSVSAPFSLIYTPNKSSLAGLLPGYVRGGFCMRVIPHHAFSNVDVEVRRNSADNTRQRFASCIDRTIYVQYWEGFRNRDGSEYSAEIVFSLMRMPTSDPISITAPAGSALLSVVLFNFGQPNPSIFRLGTNTLNTVDWQSTTSISLNSTSRLGSEISDKDSFNMLVPVPIYFDAMQSMEEQTPPTEFTSAFFGSRDDDLTRSPISYGFKGAQTFGTTHIQQFDLDATWKFMGVQVYCDCSQLSSSRSFRIHFFSRSDSLSYVPSGWGASTTPVTSCAHIITMSGSSQDRNYSRTPSLFGSTTADSVVSYGFDFSNANGFMYLDCFVTFDSPVTVNSWTFPAVQRWNRTRENIFAIALFDSGSGNNHVRTLNNTSGTLLMNRTPTMIMERSMLSLGAYVMEPDPSTHFIRRTPSVAFTRIGSAAIWVLPISCDMGFWIGPTGSCQATSSFLSSVISGSRTSISRQICPADRMRGLDGLCIPFGFTTTATPRYSRVAWNPSSQSYSCVVSADVQSPVFIPRPTLGQTDVLTDSGTQKWAICTMPPCPKLGQSRNMETGICSCASGMQEGATRCLLCSAGLIPDGDQCGCPPGFTVRGGSNNVPKYCLRNCSSGESTPNCFCAPPLAKLENNICGPLPSCDSGRTLVYQAATNSAWCACPVDTPDFVQGQCRPLCAPTETRVGANCECKSGFERVGSTCLPVCTGGKERVGTSCEDPCAGGKTRVNGVCSCPSGTEDVGGTCVSICAGGKTRVDGVCSCPSGKEDVDGTCVTSCLSDEIRKGTTCECKSGFKREGTSCVAETVSSEKKTSSNTSNKLWIIIGGSVGGLLVLLVIIILIRRKQKQS